MLQLLASRCKCALVVCKHVGGRDEGMEEGGGGAGLEQLASIVL